ncbi:MAG: hypothetical protein ACTH31_09790 [Pseudoclavibacter sp.]
MLIIIGAIAYFATQFASWTALIPAILGVVVLICGLVALKRPRAGLYAGLVIAVIGILSTAMNVAQVGELLAGEAERPAAVITSLITFVLLIASLIAGITALVRGRRHKAVTA